MLILLVYNYHSKVLSESVANALEFYGDSHATYSETQKFVRNMDKFFDCLNVRNPTEYIKKRKPNLKPYTETSDPRFKVNLLVEFTIATLTYEIQWLKEDFLKYLDEWEDSVEARTDIEDAVKTKMLLSRQTLDGLRITGMVKFGTGSEY